MAFYWTGVRLIVALPESAIHRVCDQVLFFELGVCARRVWTRDNDKRWREERVVRALNPTSSMAMWGRGRISQDGRRARISLRW